MFVPVRVAYVKRVCFGAYATVPIKRVLYCIVLYLFGMYITTNHIQTVDLSNIEITHFYI